MASAVATRAWDAPGLAAVKSKVSSNPSGNPRPRTLVLSSFTGTAPWLTGPRIQEEATRGAESCVVPLFSPCAGVEGQCSFVGWPVKSRSARASSSQRFSRAINPLAVGAVVVLARRAIVRPIFDLDGLGLPAVTRVSQASISRFGDAHL